MIAAALLALASLAPQGGIDEVRRAIDEGRLGDAYRGLAGIDDARAAARAEADVLYFARDFQGSLAAAERGLAGAPDDLFLLHRGLSAAIWLRDAPRAIALARRLGAAIAAADLGADRAWWDAEHAGLEAAALELDAGARELERRRARARATSIALIASALLAAALLARGAPAQG